MMELIVMVAVIVLLAIAILVALAVWILCKAAKEEFTEEDPCESCLRWDECNGCARERCQRQEERTGKQVPGR